MEREQRYDALLPDARAAYDTLAAAVPAPPRRLVVGYSLGAILAGLLAPHVDATHWVGVSPPTARVSLAPWRALALPKLFLGGDADFAFDRERFDAEYARLPEPRAFVALPGADHFYRKEEERVYAGIRAWLDD
jgi:alpha/beta superfamily hydrolase